MNKAFDRHLRKIRLRCHLNLLMEHLGLWLAFAGLCWVMAIVVQRSLVLEGIQPWILAGLGALVMSITMILWFFQKPNVMQVALLIDERLTLEERYSTALAVAQRKDPFARATVLDAYKTAESLRVEGQFPIRPSRRWYFTVGIWVLAGILFLFMPNLDLWGKLETPDEQEKQDEDLELAQNDINDAVAAVSSAVKQLADAELEAELDTFDQAFTEGMRPEEVKREAIKRLGDLSEKIKQTRQEKMDTAQTVRQMMRQLRGTPSDLTRELIQALSLSNFGRAARILEDIQNILEREELTDQQRQELAGEISKLAEQFNQLARQDKQLERELAKLGLDKKSAQMSLEELRQALEKSGLDQEQIEQLMRQAAASQAARSQLSHLGEALAGGSGEGLGGLAGDELLEVIDQLGEMEELQEDFYLTQATLDEIARSMGKLGEGWEEYGRYTEWMKGQEFDFGAGSGNAGQGWGGRYSDDSGNTATQQTRTKTKTGPGQVVASWVFDGPQIKGEARLELNELMEAAEQSASEAISENEIPRKYETTIQKYFDAYKKDKEK